MEFEYLTVESAIAYKALTLVVFTPGGRGDRGGFLLGFVCQFTDSDHTRTMSSKDASVSNKSSSASPCIIP